MKSRGTACPTVKLRRSSHEERGLKSMVMINISYYCIRRSSHEERGLKWGHLFTTHLMMAGRSSHEERGLKSRS